MRYSENPNQVELFSPFAGAFSDLQEERLAASWAGVFRHVVLACLPADEVGDHFHDSLGIPTKELYGMIGLVMLAESFNWTATEAVDHYLFDIRTRYALNRAGTHDTMSVASFERYKRILREDGLAQTIFNAVTDRLVEVLELDTSKQRLDSTHVFSDMAQVGRTRLMGICIKRFMTALKRHDEPAYEALPEAFRQRYAPSDKLLFADTATDRPARQALRQSVAEDLLWLVDRFLDDEKHQDRKTFKDLQRCLEEQCEVNEGRTEVSVKKKPGGNVMQNPSDPGATYDGNKGPGYQVQCSETCSDENETQLVVGAKVETAAVHDSKAVEPMLDDLESRGHLPDSQLADTAYGSDSNVCAAAQKGCELVSPCPGKPPDDVHALGPDDIVVDPESGLIEQCPAGETPIDRFVDEEGRSHAVMDSATCHACPHQKECPMTRHTIKGQGEHNTDGPQPVITTSPAERRRHERQRIEQTEEFREQYRRRAGQEAGFGGIKRTTGLNRLRVRGSPGVELSCLLKITGWNIRRASNTTGLREQIRKLVLRALRGPLSAFFHASRAALCPKWPDSGLPAAVGGVNLLLAA